MTMFDLHDTYLPQYEIAFTQSNASGVMCSYAAINNRPSCANDYILKTILRQKWNQPNAVVTTDCGAVRNVEGAPSNAATPVIAAAWTINNGTDLEMGTTVWTDYMAAAVSAGLVTEDTITTAVSRLFRVHFLAGRFDPLDQVKWAALGAESINSTWNQQVQSEAGHQGVVLLKNDADALPLKSGTTIAVVGPMAVNQDMRSDYAGSRGEAGCYPKGDTSCVITIGQSIANMNTGGTTTIVKGVDINSNNSTGIAAAVAAAKAADIVVVAVGIDRSIEHEGVDRTSTTLPGQQESLITAVQATGKPIVLVMSNGGALAIDNFLSGSNAIVEAFNIAFSAPSLADLLFGKVNRWGKLPITMYPQTFVNQKDMNDYDMSSGVGRTYRYYKGTPLYEFGHGLSLTEFSLSCTADGGGSLAFTCNVSNTGNMDGDEVIQVYHAAGEAIRGAAQHPVPIKSLVDFSRVTVTKGGVATVHFQIEQSALLLTNADGDKVLYKGLRDFIFSTGAGPEVTIPYTV